MSELNWPELNTLVGVYEENALLKQRVAELEKLVADPPWRNPDDWPNNGQRVEVILSATFMEPDDHRWGKWELDLSEWDKADGEAVRGWRPLDA